MITKLGVGPLSFGRKAHNLINRNIYQLHVENVNFKNLFIKFEMKN